MSWIRTSEQMPTIAKNGVDAPDVLAWMGSEKRIAIVNIVQYEDGDSIYIWEDNEGAYSADNIQGVCEIMPYWQPLPEKPE